jgi:hypothetical protein
MASKAKANQQLAKEKLKASEIMAAESEENRKRKSVSEMKSVAA